MAAERLSMRQTREILRQKWSLGRTHREVAQSLRISTGAVGTTVLRARAAGLDWAQVDRLSDDVLHARVYGPPTPPTHHRAVPDCAYLHAERRRPGVTLELLHLEYLEQHPAGYRYTQFCECYRRWLGRRGLSMRQVHRAGAKLKATGGVSTPPSSSRSSAPACVSRMECRSNRRSRRSGRRPSLDFTQSTTLDNSSMPSAIRRRRIEFNKRMQPARRG